MPAGPARGVGAGPRACGGGGAQAARYAVTAIWGGDGVSARLLRPPAKADLYAARNMKPTLTLPRR